MANAPTLQKPAYLAARSGQVPLLPGFGRQYRCWQRSPEPAENEPEVCPLVKTLLNQKLPNKSLGSNRFSWFLRWGVLVKVIPGLISFVPTHHLKASKGPDIHLASRLVNSIIVIRRDKVQRSHHGGRPRAGFAGPIYVFLFTYIVYNRD